MSTREKNLLLFFALAGFAIVNLLAFNFAATKRSEVTRQRSDAELKLAAAENLRASSDQVADQMQWLAEHEPQPADDQNVQTQLQQLAEREAKAAGLTIKNQKPLPTDKTEGKHYHRAKLQITVTGMEEALYQWFDKINVPDQFRIASQIRLSPNAEDDTQVDCTAAVEQWFVPSAP